MSPALAARAARLTILYALVAVILAPLRITAEQPATPKPRRPFEKPAPTYEDVKYGPHERNVVDFWKADTKASAPVVIYIHGGGFVTGDKTNLNPLAVDFFLKAGISFASISYRYSTQAPYPAPMLDGARAVQFLRSKAAEWNIDAKRIGVFGASAGAGISLWIAFHEDLAKPGSGDPVERQSSRVICAGSLAGQSSYNPLTIRQWIGGHAWEHPALVALFGLHSTADFDKPENQKIFEDASPITHLTRDAPPVAMYYDQAEDPLPPDATWAQGIHHPKFGHMLKEKMDAIGIECTYRNKNDGQQPPGNVALLEFLRDHLLR
jgi:acetyl esterase/lipase